MTKTIVVASGNAGKIIQINCVNLWKCVKIEKITVEGFHQKTRFLSDKQEEKTWNI